jgi:hypothetical protein
LALVCKLVMSTASCCAICMDTQDHGDHHDWELINLNCRHIYHHKCIKDWTWTQRVGTRVPTCPQCIRPLSEIDMIRLADPSITRYLPSYHFVLLLTLTCIVLQDITYNSRNLYHSVTSDSFLKSFYDIDSALKARLEFVLNNQILYSAGWFVFTYLLKLGIDDDKLVRFADLNFKYVMLRTGMTLVWLVAPVNLPGLVALILPSLIR